jgi:hypothetical protein
MDNMDPGTETEAGGANERRTQHNLRVIFESACKITAPFFDKSQSWGGSSLTMYARQTLREAYPELTQQEIAILFSGVTRFHRGVAKNG